MMGLHSLTHICTAQLSGSLAPGQHSEALVSPTLGDCAEGEGQMWHCNALYDLKHALYNTHFCFSFFLLFSDGCSPNQSDSLVFNDM